MKKIVLICLGIISTLSIGASAALTNQIYLPLVHRMASTTQPPPPGVQVLPNHSSYVEINTTHIFGEILNNSDSNLFNIIIPVTFYDSSGIPLESAITYPYMEPLKAGSKTCFDIQVNVPYAWSVYKFGEPAYLTYSLPLPSFSVLNENGAYDSSTGSYKITGQVTNESGFRVENVKAVGTLYNANGLVIGCSEDYVDSIDLEPGQASLFDLEMLMFGRNYSDVTSYRIQVHGDP